jgi:uncharacterized protein with HEPN domain
MKENQVYIEHILQAVEKILEYSKDMSKNDFSNNEMVQDAVIRNIEIIGEATKKISDYFKASYPSIPWKLMAGMRDKLIHDYMGVDTEVIWKTMEKDIPLLKSLLLNIDLK